MIRKLQHLGVNIVSNQEQEDFMYLQKYFRTLYSDTKVIETTRMFTKLSLSTIGQKGLNNLGISSEDIEDLNDNDNANGIINNLVTTIEIVKDSDEYKRFMSDNYDVDSYNLNPIAVQSSLVIQILNSSEESALTLQKHLDKIDLMDETKMPKETIQKFHMIYQKLIGVYQLQQSIITKYLSYMKRK